LHREGARGNDMAKLSRIIEEVKVLGKGDANHMPAGGAMLQKAVPNATPKGSAKASWDQDDAKLAGPVNGMEDVDNKGLGGAHVGGGHGTCILGEGSW
ncbi:unnamed protein product, partial [Ilex paraguariensis]